MLLGRFMMLPEANCNSQPRKSNFTKVYVWWLNKSLLVWHYSRQGKISKSFVSTGGWEDFLSNDALGQASFDKSPTFINFLRASFWPPFFFFFATFSPFWWYIFWPDVQLCISGSQHWISQPRKTNSGDSVSCWELFFVVVFLKLPAAEIFFFKAATCRELLKKIFFANRPITYKSQQKNAQPS